MNLYTLEIGKEGSNYLLLDMPQPHIVTVPIPIYRIHIPKNNKNRMQCMKWINPIQFEKRPLLGAETMVKLKGVDVKKTSQN